jgi:hypothetical protein
VFDAGKGQAARGKGRGGAMVMREAGITGGTPVPRLEAIEHDESPKKSPPKPLSHRAMRVHRSLSDRHSFLGGRRQNLHIVHARFVAGAEGEAGTFPCNAARARCTTRSRLLRARLFPDTTDRLTTDNRQRTRAALGTLPHGRASLWSHSVPACLRACVPPASALGAGGWGLAHWGFVCHRPNSSLESLRLSVSSQTR